MTDTLSDRVLWMLKKGPMTTEEIRAHLAVSRSTASNVIKHLRGKGLVCIKRYEPTGVKPIAYFGLGTTDAPRPPPMSQEEKNRRRREAKAREKAALEYKPVIRRDIAASWI
jgi:DNA-binding transcriptional ArsR family regulator